MSAMDGRQMAAASSGSLAKTSDTLATVAISMAVPMGLENDRAKKYQWQNRFTLYSSFKFKYSLCWCGKWWSMENNERRIELVLSMDNRGFDGRWWYRYLSKFSGHIVCCNGRRYTRLGTFLS